MNLKQRIAMTMLRRLLGYAGVGAYVGIDNDLTQLVGILGAAGTLIWSVVEKVRETKKEE